MSHPLISIIIPTYKRKQMLTQCIDSVLAQTYRPIEIIVVDDCSPDGTQEAFAEKYGDMPDVTIFCNEKNMGCSYNRRLGYEKSKGELIVFMDDDDYYTDTEFFSKAVKAFVENSSLSFVGANAVIKYENDGSVNDKKLNVSGFISGGDYLRDFQFKKNKPHSTFTSLFSRKMLDAADLAGMGMVNDASIYMRALLVGNAYILDDAIGVYRMHSKNISYDLSVDFLIQNLDEKRYIGDMAAERHIFDNENQWLYDQTMMTAQYFINGRGRTKQDISALCDWCRDNLSELGDKACREIKKRYSKRKLRNALKSIKSIFIK